MVGKLLRALVGWTARGVALLVVLALLLPVAAILYTTTDDFRARLLAYAVPELDRRMAGDLSVGGLEGSPLTTLRLEDVALAWHGDEIVHIPEAAVALDWSALFEGRIRIARIELDSPRVLLKQHAELGWDWRQALAPLVPGPDEHREPRPDPLPLVIESLVLEQATLCIEGLDRAPLELAGLDLRGRIDFAAKKIDVEHAGLALGASKLRAKGGLDFAGHSEAAITIESLAPRDLASLSPALAKSLDFLAPAHGALTLRGDKQSLALAGELDWPDAALAFDASGRVDRPLLAEAKVEAKLDVKDLRRFLPRAPVAGPLAVHVALDHGAGTLDARLRSGASGALDAKGNFQLGDVPETKLELVATDFDPARAFPGHPEWAGALTARGRLAARGRDRATLAASLALELGSSRIGALRLDRGALKAKLEGERIDLAELSLDAPIGRARVSGRASTTSAGPLALKSRIDVANLGPLLALAKQQGQGSLTARIDVDGSAGSPRLAGEAAVTRFRLGAVDLERTSLRMRVTRGRERSIEGVVESMALVSPLGAWRLERATAFRVAGGGLSVESASFASDDARLRLDGRLGRTGPQDFTLTARALPIADWAHEFPERVPPELLTRGVLDLELAIGGTAADPIVDLALHPRSLVLHDQPIDAIEATLRHAERRARATLHARTEPSLRLDAEAELPFVLAWTKGFVAKPAGELVAKADGEADDLSLLEPFVARSVENLGGRARAHLELEGPLDALRPRGLVTASGLTARPRRSGVTIVSGELEVELAADRFRVRRATATCARHEKTARFRAEGEGPLPVFLTRLGRAPLEEAPSTRATAANGSEPGASAATTDSTTDFTTKIEIEQWPIVETRRDQLFASGVMRARGSFEAPHVEGELEIVKGTLRPNLAFLASGPPPRDPTIELEPDPAQSGAATAGADGAGAGSGATSAVRFEAVALAVDVDLGRELWIKHEQAEVLLAGKVLVRKEKEKPVTLDGRIDAQRGFADLQGRRFRLMEGALEFVPGPKIDPLLDVLGRYKAPAHTIDARLTGTASKPVLTLTADPTLSQEDILAVLLFGRPASELSQQQQTSLGQRAEQMASAFGMTAVGRSLASAIGLEELGLQIEEISSTRAAIGAYVGRNIFVALAQEFSGERGQELSIEYEFLPGWSLVGSTTSQGTNAADLVWKIRY